MILPIEVEARRTGYGPLLAEILVEMGNLHVERGDPVAASAALEEAVWTAELSRHDEVAAKAAAQLVYSAGASQLRFDAGEIWARHADTILRRVGGHEYLWGWLFNNRSAMRERQGRLVDAVEDGRRAVATKEKVQGPESADAATSLANLAVYLEQLGELETAVHYMERAVKVMETVLGSEHPRTAVLLSNYSEILNRLGRFAEAREMSQRAVVIFEGESAPDGVRLSYPLTALGLAYLSEGMAADALPILERAVEIRDDKETKPSCLGGPSISRSRAPCTNWGEDPPRARTLAVRARAEYTAGSPIPVTTERSRRWMPGWRESRISSANCGALSSPERYSTAGWSVATRSTVERWQHPRATISGHQALPSGCCRD